MDDDGWRTITPCVLSCELLAQLACPLRKERGGGTGEEAAKNASTHDLSPCGSGPRKRSGLPVQNVPEASAQPRPGGAGRGGAGGKRTAGPRTAAAAAGRPPRSPVHRAYRPTPGRPQRLRLRRRSGGSSGPSRRRRQDPASCRSGRRSGTRTRPPLAIGWRLLQGPPPPLQRPTAASPLARRRRTGPTPPAQGRGQGEAGLESSGAGFSWNEPGASGVQQPGWIEAPGVGEERTERSGRCGRAPRPRTPIGPPPQRALQPAPEAAPSSGGGHAFLTQHARATARGGRPRFRRRARPSRSFGRGGRPGELQTGDFRAAAGDTSWESTAPDAAADGRPASSLPPG